MRSEIIKKVINKLSAGTDVYKHEIPEMPKNLQKVENKKDIEYIKYIKKLTKSLGVDPMTGLWTRQNFEDSSKREGAYLYIDGDGLKKINDEYGHAAGSAAILALSQGIKSALRGKDEVKMSRYGGDEFTVHVGEISVTTGITIAKRILESINKQKITDFFKGDEETKKKLEDVKLKASIGVGKTEDEADKALYKAKEKGRNRVEFYTKETKH